jgi:hypothetical protein
LPVFVHLAPESRANLIRRNGIGRLRKDTHRKINGVFAVPVTRNFYISHQWLRELKRRGQGCLVGVYFKLLDEEQVWVGHYGQMHVEMSAAQAAAEFMKSESREGWEVIIPRRIEANEVHKIRVLPQVLGWRYYPSAKGKQPFCACKFCTRGEINSAKLRRKLGADE